ncbi:prolipoprotein diacylglyceryl transferase [Blastococcus saxobsidens]|uniref:Putative Prolipoprotein diacylglyceryl transferase n=1 Tax=Blastococcus saxobsidens (strain DD2) TaxID=1146883 RepID=H6RQ36_BLASD|nr:prolipoprotein diacylglyceryl transferase family protein [Blastococcus saxobsidens]CCG02805.1 putative Prolipoprotein diacylglyceryl transferase [Blastococcus saxobsidens DD2]
MRHPVLAPDMPAGAVQVMSWSCESMEDVDPQALGVTYWFDAAASGAPYPVSVRFSGRRLAGPDIPGRGDEFEVVHTLDEVLPGSGRVAVTARVPGLAPGEWEVTATPVVRHAPADSAPPSALPPGPLPRGTTVGRTTFKPVADVRAPGVRIGAWPALVTLGWLFALALQGVLAADRDLPVVRLLLVSVLASLIGLVGAKVYYLLTHREERPNPLTAGMSVQGFVIAGIGSVILGSWWAGIPVGQMLDVTAPGLLVGMTIGRLGCFLGGCCVGRPTASRWGIWSSDRRVGVRRIPVQLLESSMAGLIAAATLVAVVLTDPRVDGLLFMAGLAAYTFGRQLLFPLRGLPRQTKHGRRLTLAVAGLVLLAALSVLVSV